MSVLRLLLFSICTVAFPMQAHEIPTGGEPAPSLTVRQGTVAGLRAHSLAVERIDVLEEDGDALSIRLTVTPEPGREWAASGVFAQGEVLPLSEGGYELARLQPSGDGQRATVLVKGPLPQPGTLPAGDAVPVFAGEAGTRIGETRLAVTEAPDSAQPEAVELVLWPSQYTLASSPPDSRRRERLAPGQAIAIGERRYTLTAVHPRAEHIPAFIELRPAE